ncbi:hypothetical protein B0H63DRAFT_88409 [Podospora didyma]|uniref:Secreted protein n=1 Tax=Podospora didyma TaxID=330526 RepID=A0AAE0K0V1_9PEZI|nr:hypothetical protein B0H63DRAFT_88409 [Podospora didyma]
MIVALCSLFCGLCECFFSHPASNIAETGTESSFPARKCLSPCLAPRNQYGGCELAGLLPHFCPPVRSNFRLPCVYSSYDDRIF